MHRGHTPTSLQVTTRSLKALGQGVQQSIIVNKTLAYLTRPQECFESSLMCPPLPPTPWHPCALSGDAYFVSVFLYVRVPLFR